MTGYELIIHPMVEVANELIRWVMFDVGLPESILSDKTIKDDVMAAFRIDNCKYFPYFFGGHKVRREPSTKGVGL